MQQESHPSSLWWLAAIYACFMFTFGSILASLVLYLHHALSVPLANAYAIFGAFASMMWTLPLLGGYLSGRFGHRNAAGTGLVVILVGFLALLSSNLLLSALGLACFVVGNALFTPALWCMVDQVYAKQDHRREGGFTYFYLLFNLGAVLGIFIGGFVAKLHGFKAEIALNGVVSLLALLLYLWRVRYLSAHPGRRNHHAVRLLFRCFMLCIAVLILIPIALLFLKYTLVNEWVLYVLCVVVVFVMLKLAISYQDVTIRKRIYAFMLLVLISIAFWSMYNLEPSLLSVFIKHNVNKHIFGIDIPATSFFAFEGSCIILLGLLLSRLWVYLSRRGRDLSLPMKFSLSVGIIGLGFVWLIVGKMIFGANQLMSGYWMICAYVFFAGGELLIGPIGISMVGRLAPVGKEGLMMGVWQLYQGLAAVIGGLLASVVIVPAGVSLQQSNNLYDHLYGAVAIGAVVLCLMAMCFVPVIKRLIKG